MLCNTADGSAPQQAATLVLEEGYNTTKILVDVLSIWRDYESNLSGTPHQAEYTAPINHSGRQGRHATFPEFVTEFKAYLANEYSWIMDAL